MKGRDWGWGSSGGRGKKIIWKGIFQGERKRTTVLGHHSRKFEKRERGGEYREETISKGSVTVLWKQVDGRGLRENYKCWR